MNYQFNGSTFVENIKLFANETVTARICEKLAGNNGEYGEVRTWQNNFAKWKKGESQPRAVDLIRIADVCNCSVDDLLGISQPKKSVSKLTAYDLLCVVDAMVKSENAKIEITADNNMSWESFRSFLEAEGPIEYVKVCNVKIYNNQLINLLENYDHIAGMSKQDDLSKKMCDAFLENESKNSSPLVSFSPSDISLSYRLPDGTPVSIE